jgi:hypothetical protein
MAEDICVICPPFEQVNQIARSILSPNNGFQSVVGLFREVDL